MNKDHLAQYSTKQQNRKQYSEDDLYLTGTPVLKFFFVEGRLSNSE